MKKIKIYFTDFWPGFVMEDNYFHNLLSKYFDIEISEDPDILIYSVHGRNFLNYDCHRIFYCGENYRPNFFECDFSFTRLYNTCKGKNYRLPHYVHYGDLKRLTQPKNIDNIICEKTKFCNMVVSNPYAPERIEFFRKLSQYKKVDSGGRAYNNIGAPVNNKLLFLKKYKFSIAFENSSYSGYTTEKIFEPMLVNSIPIYWGNPKIATDFNPNSFINIHQFNSIEKAIEKIKELDTNFPMYQKILEEPFFKNNQINPFVKEENVIEQFRFILKKTLVTKPVATRLKSKFWFIGRSIYKLEKKVNWNKGKLKRLLYQQTIN